MAVPNSPAASVPIQDLSTFAAVRIVPPATTPGKVMPVTPFQPNDPRDFPHHVCHRLGRGGARSEDLLAFGQQPAGGHVDRGPLDAAAADVDTECLHT